LVQKPLVTHMEDGRDWSLIRANRMQANRFGTNTTIGWISALYHHEDFKSTMF